MTLQQQLVAAELPLAEKCFKFWLKPPANWLSGDPFDSGAEGLKFEFWASQIGTVLPMTWQDDSAAIGSCVACKVNGAEIGLQMRTLFKVEHSEYDNRFHLIWKLKPSRLIQ